MATDLHQDFATASRHWLVPRPTIWPELGTREWRRRLHAYRCAVHLAAARTRPRRPRSALPAPERRGHRTAPLGSGRHPLTNSMPPPRVRDPRGDAPHHDVWALTPPLATA